MKGTSIILEGGASRAIFSCGILDCLHDNDIFIDNLVGTSAGICYGVSYISRQRRRNYKITEKYMSDKRYMGASHLMNRRNKSFYNLDFVFYEIPEHLLPFDFDTYREHCGEVYACVTNIETGLPEYIKVSPDDHNFTALRASSALPLLFPPIEIDGKKYMDGGMVDSIPFEFALNSGSDKAVIILTQPRGYVKHPEKLAKLVKLTYRKYPKLAEALAHRHEMYNEQLRRIEELEKDGKVFVLAPEKDYGIGRTEKDPKILIPYHMSGYRYCETKIDGLREFLR